MIIIRFIMEIIGISKVAIQKKITIIEQVAKYLHIATGDTIVFLKSDAGDIILRKMSDIEVKEMEEI